ncbi:aryl-alcohol oxidase 3 [Ancistrocladus abbreviatus]
MEETENEVGNLVFAVNGERFELPSIDPSTTLLEFLRSNTRFKSVKIGCGEAYPEFILKSLSVKINGSTFIVRASEEAVGGNLFKQLDSDDYRGKEERRDTNELSGLDSDESISVGWVSKTEDGVKENLVMECILMKEGITDIGVAVENFQNTMVIGGDTWNKEEEEGVRDTCEENKETEPVGRSDDELSSMSLRSGIGPKLHKKAQSIVIGLLAGSPSNSKLNPDKLGQNNKSKSQGQKNHSLLPNRNSQLVDGEKVKKRKVKRSKSSVVVSLNQRTQSVKRATDGNHIPPSCSQWKGIEEESSIGDSCIQNMNILFLKNNGVISAEEIWEVGKLFGAFYNGHDDEILGRLRQLEERDKLE